MVCTSSEDPLSNCQTCGEEEGGKDKINDVVVFASVDYRNLLAYLLMRCGGCYCSMGFQVRQVALRFAGLCSTFAGPFPRKECRDT